MTDRPFDPPASLADEGKARWRAVLPVLLRRGHVDFDLLLTYCRVWARWRVAEENIAKAGPLTNTNGRVRPSPLLSVSDRAASQVRALERRLGLGGADEANSEPLPSDPAPEVGGALLTRRELAALLGKHMQTITKWEREGLPIAELGRRGRPSRYRETEVRDWLAAREAAAAGDGRNDAVKQRAEKERWQARLAEQMVMARSRELLPRAEVEKAWAAEVAAVRSRLLAWPVTLADRLHRASTLEGVAGVERVLNDAVREVLIELSAPRRQDADVKRTPDGRGHAA